MAGTYHGITDFVTQVRKTDFARSNRYEVSFQPPSFLEGHSTTAGESPKVISMMVEDGMFPGILIGTRPLRINNLNEQRANAIDFGGDSITFTFLVDAAWTAKDFFGDWMRSIVNPVSRYVSYPNEYYSTIDLVSLNNNDDVIAHWRIIDAFPRSIAPITVSATNAQVLRMPVTFAYKKWQVIGGFRPDGQPIGRQESTDIDPEFGFDESQSFGEDFDGQELVLDDTFGNQTEFEDI
jgi:hypothetical protein